MFEERSIQVGRGGRAVAPVGGRAWATG